MSRDLDAATQASSEANLILPVALVKLEFDSGDVFLSSWTGDITYNGDVYTGSGALATIGPVDEDNDLTRNKIQIGLRSITNEIVSIALREYVQGRPATIYMGYLNEDTMQLTGEPVIITGTMDNWNFTIGKQPTIILNVEDEFAILDKANTRRYTNADQQSRYPTDRFFEYVEQATAKDISWGR